MTGSVLRQGPVRRMAALLVTVTVLAGCGGPSLDSVASCDELVDAMLAEADRVLKTADREGATTDDLEARMGDMFELADLRAADLACDPAAALTEFATRAPDELHPKGPLGEQLVDAFSQFLD